MRLVTTDVLWGYNSTKYQVQNAAFFVSIQINLLILLCFSVFSNFYFYDAHSKGDELLLLYLKSGFNLIYSLRSLRDDVATIGFITCHASCKWLNM